MSDELHDQVLAWAEQENRARETESGRPRTDRPLYARLRLLTRTGRSRRRADRAWERLPESALDIMANDLIVAAWTREAADLSTRHPFHPSLDAVRRERLPEILARLRAEPLGASWSWGRAADSIIVPGLVDRLDAARAAAALQAVASEVQTRAEDDAFLVVDQSSGVVIQHKETGLRAEFTVRGDGFGIVNSKPHRVISIDPDRPRTDDEWRDFLGLEIGPRIYHHAALLHPEVRWISETSSDASVGLRMKLHAEDPLRWEGPCRWCVARRICWREAHRSDLTGHPRTSRT